MSTGGQLRAVELFAGGGGMALGTHKAGYQHIALLELDQHAVATLKENVRRGVLPQPCTPLQATDVRTFNWQARRELRNIDLLAGGAPCQPFSLGGVHRGQDDRRNLFPEVFRAQRELLPKALLLENVRGLARPAFRPYLEYILLQLALPAVLRKDNSESWEHHKLRLLKVLANGRELDFPTYDVWAAAVECANFGVPQRRNRVFMVALRTDLGLSWDWPKALYSESALLHTQIDSGSYWREHQIQPSFNKPFGGRLEPLNGHDRWRTVRDALRCLPEPRLSSGTEGHPNHIYVPGARAYAGHSGSPLDEPAKALKAGVHGVPGGENMLRLENGSVRYFSIHEAALLQTFPEEYIFCGSRTAAMRQIGNAAPVKVVRLMAEQIAETLRKSKQGRRSGLPHVDLIGGAPLTTI